MYYRKGEKMEEKNHFRVPVSEAYRRKSPFGQLLEHMGKVRECIDLLGDGLIKYCKGDYKGLPELSKKVIVGAALIVTGYTLLPIASLAFGATKDATPPCPTPELLVALK